MVNIETVVRVDIVLAKAFVTQKVFGRGMILSSFDAWASGTTSDRFRIFTSAAAVLDEGTFDSTSTVYLAAVAYFSAAVCPEDLMIGRCGTAESYTDGLTAITARGGGSAWYGLIASADTVAKDDILEIAAWVEASTGRYIYIATNGDAEVLAGTAGNVALSLQALLYARTDFFYHDPALVGVTEFPDAAEFGLMLPKLAGSATYENKSLVGITADALTDNEIANLLAADAQYYVEIGGLNVTQNTRTADGDFIDIQVGIDWLRATMEQDVWAFIASQDKVPFTDGGIQGVGSIMRSVLMRAVDPQDILADFTLDIPLRSDFTSEERATRILTKIGFSGGLAGAIHKARITGNLSF